MSSAKSMSTMSMATMENRQSGKSSRRKSERGDRRYAGRLSMIRGRELRFVDQKGVALLAVEMRASRSKE